MQNNDLYEKVCRVIIHRLLNGGTEEKINKLKTQVCKKYSLNHIPSNSEILAFAANDEREKLRSFLQLKPIRSLSGVNVIAVMSKPFDCPHGKCIYCPGGTKFGVPSSYTGLEPATMRGIQNNFNPYLQVKSRIRQLKAIGHVVNKVDLIVMGGTFPATPIQYQEDFMTNCLNALTNRNAPSLGEAKQYAEASSIRNVGITFETRPDYAKEHHINEMLRLGATRVEIGVQTIYDDLYQLAERGHNVYDVIEATRLLKDAGVKVCYHIMPNLPGSNYDKDIETFKALFNNAQFQPDELKIYPTLVLKGTKLYDKWKNGDYTPLTDEKIIEMLVCIKSKYVPKYVRIKRIMRDIPSTIVIAGPKLSNLRELVWKRLQEQGQSCLCIRCREVGHNDTKLEADLADVKLSQYEYKASEGTEVFISFDDLKSNALIGFLRLRIPSTKAHRNEIKGKQLGIVRALHVYGPLVKIGENPSIRKWQHRGFGRKLLAKAEEIAQEQYDATEILVTSGLGAKEYYQKIGYTKKGVYMSKTL
ncbi:MAG: tRNA uridine(34) 5-carboxymethylaminomethyl modification radical SAM/GNAT enzyme Elp3 [Candidatus Bathyarchaeota archaeon]|nr:MAG: tRNA uridine(34) 5-carboxymethylaminomethyl modification radical SAM/GNAT enzyme Elp3 [Candidatus Bathyarchaeota archaeon]